MQIWRVRDWVYVMLPWGAMGLIREEDGVATFTGLWLVGNPHGEAPRVQQGNQFKTIEEHLNHLEENEKLYREPRK